MESKVVVITGASSGIGAATAKLLAARSDKVVLAARREARLQQVAADCGTNAKAVITDVTHRNEIMQLKDEALKAFGQVDVWINNAGRGINRPVLDLTDEEFDQMLLVNAKSALYGMQAIVPYFKERGLGHLINVSSALSRLPFATYRSAYSAAKAALNILTAQLWVDLRKDYPNIHISTVMPAIVQGEFGQNALYGTPPFPPNVRAGNMFQTAEQVAAAIVDLIDHPKPEVYTIPDQGETIARYYADVEGFEQNLGR